jgi:hypothetical protein
MMTTRIKRSLKVTACMVAVLPFLTPPVLAQSRDEKRRQKEMQEAMQREARPVLTLINELQKTPDAWEPSASVVNPKENDPAKAITPATPAVTAANFGFRYDMMKAQDNKVYVPYTMTFPADALPSGPVSIYLRIAPKGAPPPGPEVKENRFPFEDYFSVEPRTAAGQPARVMRAFAAPPGEYDVYFALRPKPADPKKSRDEPVKVVAFKTAATLSNFWTGELSTSTVVITNKVDQVQGQVSPEMQRERPYLFGNTEFTPSLDNRFKKADELSIVFQIYNPTLEAGKPNVTVEYSFHQKLTEGEKYFNKTSPQELNGQTLPPNFDVTTTQMLPGGQSVPLASFPPGDYRMEIKITDVNSKKTITRDVMFTVLAS